MAEPVPAAEVFPVDHYDTARQVGIDHFSDAWGEATAELGLTIQALENAHGRPPYFRREDLIGYHYLHYGADNEVTGEVLDGSIFDTDWARPLNDALPGIIDNPRTVQPIDLGRITLDLDTEVDHELAEVWTERINVNGNAAAGRRMGAVRLGEFLRPKPGVMMRYLGRASIDMMQESPNGYVRSDRSSMGGIILNELAFHVDTFTVGGENQAAVYNALSYSENSHTSLKSIVKAEDFVSLQPIAWL